MARKAETPCAGCGKLLWGGRTALPPGERTCHQCRWNRKGLAETPKPTNCAHCGVRFTSRRKSNGKWTTACSHACGIKVRQASGSYFTPAVPAMDSEARRDMWAKKNHRRRAAKRGVASEPYSLAEIAERDGNRCGLCQRVVRMDVPFPKLGSPTVDHIIPLAKGGDDTRRNVQLAHFGCNSGKRTRAMGEQLRLVG